MGGVLHVASQPGEGSRFVLELPRWDTPPPGSPGPSGLA
jgi:signal transduction histidine kinase